MKASIILLLTIICVSPVFAAERTIDFGDLKLYETANPYEDIEKAITRGDLRFMGAMGYGLDIPGVYNYHEDYSRYGYKVMKGTSDVIKSYEHGRLIRIAIYYAKAYNQALEKHINTVAIKKFSRTMPGFERVNKFFEISAESSGLSVNDKFGFSDEMFSPKSKPPKSFHANLSAKDQSCLKKVKWYNPLKDDKPVYDWNQFLDLFYQTNQAVCQQSWIGDWIKSGENRIAETKIFGLRPDTDISSNCCIETFWKESGLASEPWYIIDLRDGDNWKGTAYLAKDANAAIITTLERVRPIKRKKNKHRSHWLDKLSLRCDPENPEYIVVDKSGNWKVVK